MLTVDDVAGIRLFSALPPAELACHDLRRFLARNQLAFEWLTPDDESVGTRWPAGVPGDDAMPALLLSDGITLTRPQPRELAQRLGLQTHGGCAEYDTIIVRAGPAGLAAAVYGASEALRTLVVEREAPGGQAGTSSRIENYLGFPTASRVTSSRSARCSRPSAWAPRSS